MLNIIPDPPASRTLGESLAALNATSFDPFEVIMRADRIARELYELANDVTMPELNARLDDANMTWREVCAAVGRPDIGTDPASEICRRCRQLAPCADCEERAWWR